MRTFIIAEAGVNHNGREDLALQLIETAAQCGADAVKFQTFSADKLVRKGTAKAAYQIRQTSDGDQHQMLKQLELSWATYEKLFRHCEKLGVEFMSTPFDDDALELLTSLGMKRVKIPSGEITNIPFLRVIAATGLPLILSTGMADLSEIGVAIETILKTRQASGFIEPLADVLTILHCTSNYPASYYDVNLRAMQTIADTFSLPVGYSDHTLGASVSTAAVALGAVTIEKHFTLDRGMHGPDHQASLSPDELSEFVQQLRQVELAMGSPIKAPVSNELAVRNLVRRSVTSTQALRHGQIITRSDLTLQRPGDGIAPTDLDHVVGRVAGRNIDEGQTLTWADIT